VHFKWRALIELVPFDTHCRPDAHGPAGSARRGALNSVGDPLARLTVKPKHGVLNQSTVCLVRVPIYIRAIQLQMQEAGHDADSFLPAHRTYLQKQITAGGAPRKP
jgi:hypothetical protein